MAAVDTPVPTDSDWDLLQPGFRPLLPQLAGKDASMISVRSGAKVGAIGGKSEREISDPPPTPGRTYPPGFHGCAGPEDMTTPGTDLSREIPLTRLSVSYTHLTLPTIYSV